jgi:hypothetical protein
MKLISRATGVFSLALAASSIAQPAAGPPAAPTLEFAFEEIVYLEAAIVPGKTAYGSRNLIPITGGTFEGPGMKGVVMPGGWDWQLIRADGCIDVKADYMIKTDDGVIINVINTGAICMPKAGEAPRPVRTQPRFEAPLGKYEWLSQTAFIGTLDLAQGPGGKPAVRIRIYKAM